MPKLKKKSVEEEASDLWDIAVKLRSNGRKVDIVVDCNNSVEINKILAQLSRLYGTPTVYVTHVFPKDEWRLKEDVT